MSFSSGQEYESYQHNFELNLTEDIGFSKVEIQKNSVKNILAAIRRILSKNVTESLNLLKKENFRLFLFIF